MAKAQRLVKARPALHYLNEKTGRQFRDIESNLTPIAARMEEVAWDIDGIKVMIDRQVARWKGTPQEEYLRPETLFGKTKFDSYWSARELPVVPVNGSDHASDDQAKSRAFWKAKAMLEEVESELKRLTSFKAADALGVVHYTEDERTRLENLRRKKKELRKVMDDNS